MDILLTGGAGDVFALESTFTEEERSSLRTIYWATKTASLNVPLFKASKRYKHVEHVVLPVKRGKTYFELEGVRADFELPDDIEDWSVKVRFGEFTTRPYSQSTFLSDGLASVKHFELPDDYLCCQHQTPINSIVQRFHRDIDDGEWTRIIEQLEEHDRRLVVVNSADAGPAPDHPRITDLTGKTTYAESIAILAGASGYWGIASSLCVLASQLFSAGDLWVKGPEAWLWQNRHIYFAPHTTYPFLYVHLVRGNRATPLNRNMQQIEFKVMRFFNGQLVGPGSVVDMTPQQAREFIDSGQAVPYVPKPILRTASVKPVKHRATRFDA